MKPVFVYGGKRKKLDLVICMFNQSFTFTSLSNVPKTLYLMQTESGGLLF